MNRALLIGIGAVTILCAAFVAGLLPPIAEANAAASQPSLQPGQRCTRFADKKPKKTDPAPGTRCTRFYAKHKRGKFFANMPPTVGLTASAAIGGRSEVSALATDPDGDTLLYTYSTTGGRINGEGPKASWDLSSVASGTYTLTVEVDDGCGCIAYNSTNVTVP